MKVDVKHIPVRVKQRPEYKMAYWEIDSDKPGPSFLVTAAMHGNEVTGSEVLRRFCPLAEKELLKGKMILVPFANPLALWNRRPHISSTLGEPRGAGERDNINRVWPGDPEGNESEQVAHVLFTGLFRKIMPDYYIDLHCYNKFTLACALGDRDSKASMDFARISAFPVLRFFPFKMLCRKGISEKNVEGPPLFSLQEWVHNNGGKAFVVEFSGQYAVVEREVEIGLRMLKNCAKYAGMFEGELEGTDRMPVFVRDDAVKHAGNVTVKAPFAGLFAENGFSNGDFVEKGCLLGTLFEDETLKTVEIRSPESGYLYLYGSARKNCDIDLAAMHPYSDKGGVLAIIIPLPAKPENI